MKKKIFPMMNKFWHDEYGKPRKLWHGGYSTLENPFKYSTKEQGKFDDIIAKNMTVPVEDCGFDKRLTKKFWENGISTLGDVYYMSVTTDCRKSYTQKQYEQIGSVKYDAGIYYNYAQSPLNPEKVYEVLRVKEDLSTWEQQYFTVLRETFKRYWHI
jgi:hypothetical protein